MVEMRGHKDYGNEPTFFEQDGDVLFVFGVDARNVIGPRKATSADRETYPEAYKAFFDSRRAPKEEPEIVPNLDQSEPKAETTPKRGPGRPRRKT